MKPMHLAVLGAVLAVVAVLFFVMQDDEQGRRRQHGDTDQEHTSKGPDTDQGKKEGEANKSAAEGDLGVTLKVVGPDGKPALAATITLVGFRTRDASTDELGAAAFEGLPSGFYDLSARKGNAVASRSFELDKTTDLGTLTLVDSVAISGFVYDPQGAPIAGARVDAVLSDSDQSFDFSRLISAWIRPDAVAAAAKTGPDGAYTLRVAKGATFALRVVASGFAQDGEPARAYHADTAELNFHLFRGTTVAGVVVDPDGAPIVGARIMITDQMALFGRRMAKSESSSAADGTFSMSVTPAQQTMMIVRAAGFALHMDRLKMPATSLRITLEPGIQLRLRAIDADEPVPAPGVTVLINYKGGFANGTTDDRGELLIEHLPTKAGTAYGRQQEMYLLGGGFVPRQVKLAQKDPVDGVLDVGDVKMKRGGTISGRVLDKKTHNPIPGVTVRAFGGMDMQMQFLGSIPAITNKKGEYKLIGVALGASMLFAHHPDYITDFNPGMFMQAQSGTTLFQKGETEIEKDIEITPAAVVEGQVVDPEGNPVAGATVTIPAGGQEMMMLRIIGGGVAEAISDAEGKFRMRGLKEATPAKLQAKHRSYGSSKVVSVNPGSGEPVVLRLTEPIRLQGVVVDEQGDPIEGVRVTVSRKGTPNRGGMMMPMQEEGTSRPAVTDAKGEYLVRDAPEGELVMSFEHDGYRPKHRPVSTNSRTPMQEVDKTTLERGPVIEGIVLDEQGEPVGRVAVNATMAFTRSGPATSGEGRQWATDVSDEKGRFSLHGLRDGEYQVQPYMQGSYGESKRVAVGTKGVRLQLTPAAELKGRVTANGQPVAGASVRVEPVGAREDNVQGRGLGYARTNAAGEFTVTPLPPDGRFTVFIDHDAYATRKVDGVTPGGAARDFVLDQGVRIGGVVVDHKNNPVPNARISVNAAGKSKSVQADVEGRFAAGGLGDGEITIEVPSWSGFVKQDPIPVTPGDMSVRVVIERGAEITGSVVGGKAAELRGVRVEAVDENGEVASTVWVWEQQRTFQLRGLRRGTYAVRVSRFVDNDWKVLGVAEGIASGSQGVEVAIE